MWQWWSRELWYTVYDNYEDDNCDKDDQENGDIYDNYEDDKW